MIAERRYAFMLEPVVQTLLVGLQRVAVNHTVSVGGGRGGAIFFATKGFGRGDLFVFVGRYGLLDHNLGTSRALELLTQRGVTVVYYNADPDDCLKTHVLPVHEIWDYSWSTIEQCRQRPHLPSRPLRTRYVPPGCVRGCQDRNVTPPAFAVRALSGGATLSMFGVGQARRVACLHNLSVQLRALQAARSVEQRQEPDPQAKSPPPPPPQLLEAKVINHAWTQSLLEHAVAHSPLTLNLHKECDEMHHGSRHDNADCETFRFAQMLSLGAHVLSEPCPAAEDEREWRNLIDFVPFGSLAAHAVVLHSNPTSVFRSEAAARARHQRFTARFDPARIMERAGVVELARELSSVDYSPVKTTSLLHGTALHASLYATQYRASHRGPYGAPAAEQADANKSIHPNHRVRTSPKAWKGE